MEPGRDYIGVGCGALIINDKKEVLLVRRGKDARTEPGFWSRPGGAVEFGETATNAAIREVLEETGVVIEIISILEMTQVIEKSKHWIALGYLAKYISGEARNIEPDKHQDVRWFPLANLPKNLTSYTRNSIGVYLRNRK